jgi:hypothetical protein
MKDHSRLLLILLTLASTPACTGNNTTAPSPTSTTVASPTTTETFTGTLPVGGARFYSFVVSQNGTVNVTLVSVSGVDVTSTLGIAIGAPSGTGCSGGAVTSTAAGTDPQLTGTYGPGRYCVNVSDAGTLAAPATFIVTIAHP